MLKYRAYDIVTKQRHLVETIDFKNQKCQLVTPIGQCNLRYIRIFPQVHFERYLNYKDKNSWEIYEGDLLEYMEHERLFKISDTLKVYNDVDGVVGDIEPLLPFLQVKASQDY